MANPKDAATSLFSRHRETLAARRGARAESEERAFGFINGPVRSALDWLAAALQTAGYDPDLPLASLGSRPAVIRSPALWVRIAGEEDFGYIIGVEIGRNGSLQVWRVAGKKGVGNHGGPIVEEDPVDFPPFVSHGDDLAAVTEDDVIRDFAQQFDAFLARTLS